MLRPKKNKALFPAHRVTKINFMRAAAKIIFLEHLKRKISSEIRNKVDELDDFFKSNFCVQFSVYSCFISCL